jgi:hypothetical protein
LRRREIFPPPFLLPGKYRVNVAAPRQNASDCTGIQMAAFSRKPLHRNERGAPANGTCNVGAVRLWWPSARTEPQARRYNRNPQSEFRIGNLSRTPQFEIRNSKLSWLFSCIQFGMDDWGKGRLNQR